MDNNLRNECKYLKCYQGITYKEIAEYLEVRQDSFYSWLKGYYNFSIERKEQLKDIIANLRED